MIYETKVSKDNPIAIIGCPRSGTGYAAHYFDIGHEKLSEKGISSWRLIGPKPRKTSINLSKVKRLMPNVTVFHQTRHPVKVISSMTTMGIGTWVHVSRVLKLKKEDGKLINSMKFWLHWNKMAEEVTDLRYRVEDIDSVFLKFFAERLD